MCHTEETIFPVSELDQKSKHLTWVVHCGQRQGVLEMMHVRIFESGNQGGTKLFVLMDFN